MASSGSRPLAELLREAADLLENDPGSPAAAIPTASTSIYTTAPTRTPINLERSPTPWTHTSTPTPRHPVDAEVSRLFSPYRPGGSRSTSRRTSAVSPRFPSYTHVFCCLEEKNALLVPSRSKKNILADAGLGEKRLTFRGNPRNPEDFTNVLIAAYPKLQDCGGYELLKISGSTRSRTLNVIPCPSEGYHVGYLKDPQTEIGFATIYIRPIQMDLNIDPSSGPCSSQQGPLQKCLSCGEEFPFGQIRVHTDECRRLQSYGEEEMMMSNEGADPPQIQDETLPRPQDSDTERTISTYVSVTDDETVPGPVTPQEHGSHADTNFSTEEQDWMNEPDPKVAAKRFRDDLLRNHATRRPLNLGLDMAVSAEDIERAILTFYKMPRVEWASPLICTLKDDPAVGDGVTRHCFATIMSKLQHGFVTSLVPGGNLLFVGEEEHLVPSTSRFLLESDFFIIAGRMMGHSFLHGGPCLGGLSPAILHVLFGGSQDEATIDIKDCADLDIRETIVLLDGTAELSSEDRQSVNDLALSWDLPRVTPENRRWLHDKLLLHAVLGRTSIQVKHLRRGLKETSIWPLLSQRKDVVPLLFPRVAELLYTSQMVLENINWPTLSQDEDAEVSLEDTCRTTCFLRTFILNAPPHILGGLVQFWVGWKVLPPYLDVEVVESLFPKSATCFHLLKLPGHYRDYSTFETELLAAISCNDAGFGLV